MVEYNTQTNQALDSTLRALADPTRRHILNQLTSGEKRVTEIAQPIDMSLNSVSKHIMKLEASGLVRRRKQGREHFLMLVPKPLNEATQWFLTQRSVWNRRLDRLEALLENEDKTEEIDG